LHFDTSYLMSTFGKDKSTTFWTEYLQDFLNNNLVCRELRCIENWIEKIRLSVHFVSPEEIRGGLAASWNLWKLFFKSDYPELFLFLKQRHFFLAGSEYITAINRIRRPTVKKFHILTSTHRIFDTVGILHTVIKATVILLSNNHNQLSWVHSKFHSNTAIKNFSLNLLNVINPDSPVFRRNLVSTE